MNKKLLHSVLISIIFLTFSTSQISAELFINEFSSASSTDDWIELYNSGTETVALNEYRIRDDTATNKLDLDGALEANGFKVFSWSNKLNNSGDIIKLLLKNDENNIKNQVSYGDKGNDVAAPLGDQTAGRSQNGSAQWVIFTNASKESANTNSSIATSPTSTPAPTLKPTPTLKPSPTPTKVPTPIKSPTPPKSTSTASPTKTTAVSFTSSPTVKSNSTKSLTTSFAKSVNLSGIPTSILDASSRSADKNIHNNSKNKKVLVQSSAQNNFRTFALGFGLISLACAILVFWKKLKNYETNSHQ